MKVDVGGFVFCEVYRYMFIFYRRVVVGEEY